MFIKISWRASLDVFMAKGNLAKEMEKDLKRQKGISDFIYENKGNQEKGEVKGHMLHVRRKMKENSGKLKKLEA